MGRDIVLHSLVFYILFAQINASASLPNHDHHAESVTKDSKPSATKRGEHRSRSHPTKDDETERTKSIDFGMANGGHWEWVPDGLRNNAYVFQPPAVGAPMYPYGFIPMPMWLPSGIPPLSPASPLMSSTTQPEDRAADNHMKKHKTSEGKVHQRSHGSGKNNEPKGRKHAQSKSHHKRNEGEKRGSKSQDGRNKKDGNVNPRHPHHTNHHKTIEGSKINENKIPDSGTDHQHHDSDTHSMKGQTYKNLPANVGTDKSVTNKLGIHSQTDLGNGNVHGAAGSTSAQTDNIKSELDNKGKPEQSPPHKSNTTQ